MMLQFPMSASAYYTYDDGTRESNVYREHWVFGDVYQFGHTIPDSFSIPNPEQEISFVNIDDSLIYDYYVDSIILKEITLVAFVDILSAYYTRQLLISVDIDLRELWSYYDEVLSFNNIVLEELGTAYGEFNMTTDIDIRSFYIDEELTDDSFENIIELEITNNFIPPSLTTILLIINFRYQVQWKPYLSPTFYLIIISAITLPLIIAILIMTIRRRRK